MFESSQRSQFKETRCLLTSGFLLSGNLLSLFSRSPSFTPSHPLLLVFADRAKACDG